MRSTSVSSPSTAILTNTSSTYSSQLQTGIVLLQGFLKALGWIKTSGSENDIGIQHDEFHQTTESEDDYIVKQKKYYQQFTPSFDELESQSDEAESKTIFTPTDSDVVGQFPSTVSLSNMTSTAYVEFTGRPSDVSTGFGLSSTEESDVFGDGQPGVVIASKDSQKIVHAFLVKGGSKTSVPNPFPLESINGTNGIRFDGTVPNQINADLGISVAVGSVLPNHAPAIIVSAEGQNNSAGITYVVPAGTALGNKSPILLNSSNVVTVTGENPADYSGFPLSSADIDGDGQQELIVSADNYGGGIGRVYAAKNVGKQTSLSLSDPSVIKFVGDSTTPPNLGFTTDSKGDVNKDGISDLVVGSYGGAGTYVAFGGSSCISTSNISLKNITKGCGVVMQGKPPVGSTFTSVATGDVNGDGISDVMVAIPGVSVTVMFGGRNLTTPFDMASTNGKNGFTVTGTTGTGISYSSIASADINGDGIDDMIIGSPLQTPIGTTFVVFGNGQIGSTGKFSLSALNGMNGFTITGRASGDSSGGVISRAGDFNSDGVDDFMVSSTGRRAVDLIYGDTLPVLQNRNFTIGQGETITVTPAMLSAFSRNHGDSQVVFTVTGAQDINFIRGVNTTTTNFTQAEVKAGNISLVHDGSSAKPGFSVGVTTTGLAYVPPTPAQVVFSIMPVITENSLVIRQGDTVNITTQNISAYTTQGSNSTLTYIASNVQHGQFLVNGSAQSNFTGKQLESHLVEFEQSDEPLAPAYNLTVSDGVTSTPPQEAKVSFTSRPQLRQGSLKVKVRPQDTIQITSDILNTTDLDGQVNETDLVYQVSGVENGYFSRSTQDHVTNFTQQDISNGSVVFHPTPTFIWPWNKPEFSVSVFKQTDDLECKDCPVDADVEIEDGAIAYGGMITAGLVFIAAVGFCLYKNCKPKDVNPEDVKPEDVKPEDVYDEVANVLKAHFYVKYCYFLLCSDCCAPSYKETARIIVDGLELKPEEKHDGAHEEDKEHKAPAVVAAAVVLRTGTKKVKSDFYTALKDQSSQILLPDQKHQGCCQRLFRPSPTITPGQAEQIKNGIPTQNPIWQVKAMV